MAGILFAAMLPAADVKVTGKEGAWELRVDGKPYFVKGGGGGADKTLLAKMGGNSFRTWGTNHAQKELEIGKENGLTVTLGYWLGHERHGFDYSDAARVKKQFDDVKKVVEQYKDHPSLLIWAFGNEMEMDCKHPVELWTHINELAKMAKAIDPHHPVMTVIAEIPNEKVKLIHQYCPDVDIIGINTYGGVHSIAERWRNAGGTKPFIVTEFGPAGHWETGRTLGMPNEPTSTEKGEWMAGAYQKAIEGERGKLCLGSYAFTWGWKMEATPTWYGMLLPDGSVLATAEAMQIAWNGPALKNHVPVIKPIKNIDAKGDNTYIVTADASDPDHDKLAWTWSLIHEGGNYDTGGEVQAMAPDFPDAIIAGQGTSVATVKLPGGGNFRLYAYVRDGKGGAAYANVPLKGDGQRVEAKIPRVALPCAVYADGAPERWFPSGYMGNTGAVKMDLACTDSPYSGDTCIRVDYNASDNWAGVMWQSPANDWGKAAGGFNLDSATMLEFWARGEKGGEKISFQIGGLDKTEFPDSDKVELKDVTLKPQWTRYRIPLDGRNLSCIKTGFQWVIAHPGKPVTFYLDDIRYTND